MNDTLQTLGVVAICYNEEEDLPGFLQNLLPWVHEIVLVDDGSKDQTSEIANSASPKVKFLRSPRQDGEFYADQRNKGIAAATSDWLLHMDIDERVPPAMAQEILQAIQSTQYDAYSFRRLNYFLHRPMRGGGWSDWNLVHLARREVLRFGGMFHESIHLSVPDHRIGSLRKSMHHFNDASYEERLRKSMTYQAEVVQQMKNRKVSVNALNMTFACIIEFLKKYVFKRGALDGMPGLISAIHSTCAVFRAYAILWDEQNRIPRDSLNKGIYE